MRIIHREDVHGANDSTSFRRTSGEERQERVSPFDETSYHRGVCTVKLVDELLPAARSRPVVAVRSRAEATWNSLDQSDRFNGMSEESPLTTRRIFWFWLPLAAMWLLMAVEQPMVASVIARLAEPESNLAVFGVAFSLTLIVESPIIMLLTAGTALAKTRDSYTRLLHFTHILSAMLTGLHLLIGLTPLYDVIVGRLIGVPTGILEPSRTTFLLMVPCAAAIAYRRLWEGMLIRFRRTRVIPFTTTARLLTGGGMLVMGVLTNRFRGSDVGAIALSVGVTTSAVVAYCFTRPVVRQELATPSSDDEPLTWAGLLRFYVPLALTPLINLAGRPVLLVGLARAVEPLASLAVWPVIMGALFFTRSLALSFQEVVVALIDEERSFEKLRRFAYGLSVVLTGCVTLVVLRPFAYLFYQDILGLSSELLGLAIVPTVILALVPGLETMISWRHGLLVQAKHTGRITSAVVLNVAVMVTVMLGLCAVLPRVTGTIIAAISLTAAVAAQWSYLSWVSRDVKREFEPIDTPILCAGQAMHVDRREAYRP
jgi:hypothetical protein